MPNRGVRKLEAAVCLRLPWTSYAACDHCPVCSAALAEACGIEPHWTTIKTHQQSGGSRALSVCQPGSQRAVRRASRRFHGAGYQENFCGAMMPAKKAETSLPEQPFDGTIVKMYWAHNSGIRDGRWVRQPQFHVWQLLTQPAHQI